MKVKADVDDNKYKTTQNSRFAQVAKLKLKWKTIKWLTENKKGMFVTIIIYLLTYT